MTDRDRAELAKVLGEHAIVATGLGEWCCRCDPMTWQPTVTRPRHLADAVLASPWLADHVRAKQAEALREAAEACRRMADQAEIDAGGKLDRWDAFVEVEDWLRDRADRLRDGV